MNIKVTHNSKRATCKSENWLLQTKDRHHMEYIEDNNAYVFEVEFGYDENFDEATIFISVYIDSIKAVNSNNIQLNYTDKERIKNRIERGLDAMGAKYEFC